MGYAYISILKRKDGCIYVSLVVLYILSLVQNFAHLLWRRGKNLMIPFSKLF